MVYRGAPNYNGSDTLTVTTSDQEATDRGKTLSDKEYVAITVSAVNDAQVLALDGATPPEYGDAGIGGQGYDGSCRSDG